MKRIVNAFFVLASFAIFNTHSLQSDENTGVTIIEDRATFPLLDPTFAERKTLKIKLNNGLQALLVSDPHTDKSAAALVVKTGWWEDPKDSPGIAHFLEHMLFLGTQKYPEEMEYSRFITEHGGLFNAFTTSKMTAYMFTIDNTAYPEAIDRFSSFFKQPLFNPSGVDRELTAIDQEYAKNVENDDIRAYYVLNELGNPEHPQHSFGMGNREALSTVSQDTLKQWYRDHYSANRMVLEAISPMPLDKLQELVVEAFGGILNKDLPENKVTLPFFTDAIKAHMITVEPLMNARSIKISWEIPLKFTMMKEAKPEQIICNLLGDEGEHSLLDELKNEKLADSIQCGKEWLGDDQFLLSLQINLTDAGVKEVDKVILRAFEAIANLKQKQLPDYIYNEFKTLSDLNYQFQTRTDPFQNIFTEAQLIALEDLSTYPENSQLIKKFDREATRELINYLTPENAVFILLAPQPLLKTPLEKKEKWLGASYSVKAIPEKTLALWESAVPNQKIDIPAPNPYIPENTASLSVTTPADIGAGINIPTPTLVFDNENGRVYFARDDIYHTPTVSWNFYIRTPSINSSKIESEVLGTLYSRYANEILKHFTYPASEAGLKFSLSSRENGIVVSIDGYSDKADVLFFDMIHALKEMKPREQKFRILKERMVRDLQDMALESPLIQSFELFGHLIYKDRPLSKTSLAALKKITFDDFTDFCNEILAQTYIQGTIFGNMSETDAKSQSSRLVAALDSLPYPKEEQFKIETINLPADHGPFYVETKSKVQGNATLLAIEATPFSTDERAIQDIAMQAIKEPFYTNLRTRQQTGYIVYSDALEIQNHLFNLFAVQSNTHDPRDLLSRFELSIEEFIQEIDKGGVSEEKFENIRQSLLISLKYPVHNMQEMGALLFKMLVDWHGDFDRVAKRIDSLKNLSYQQFLDGTKETFGKNNKRRLAILFTGSIPEEGSLKYTRLCSNASFRDKVTYCKSETEPSDDE